MATKTTPYSKTDKTIAYLNKQYARMFRRVTAFDELNVIEASREVYDEAYTLAEREATRLAEVIYKDHSKEERVFDAAGFVLALILAYNPVTKYVFKNEIERKRARFAEGLIASDTPHEEIARAKRLLAATNAQFMDDVTFDTMVTAFRDNGTRYVRWVTSPDDRRCKVCARMHGKRYPIDRVPPKPHIHCRCWVVEEVDTD